MLNESMEGDLPLSDKVKFERISKFEYQRFRNAARPRIVSLRSRYSEEALLNIPFYLMYNSIDEFKRVNPTNDEQEAFVDAFISDDERFREQSEKRIDLASKYFGIISFEDND